MTNELCSVLRSAELSGPGFGGVTKAPLAAIVRSRADGRATVTFTQGKKQLLRRTVALATGATARVPLPAKRAKPGDVRVKIVFAAGADKRTVKLAARRLR